MLLCVLRGATGMARRSDIDWEAIERDYRAGVLTVREISSKHGVDPSSITSKVKKFGWSRDLSGAIKKRTKEKVASIGIENLVEQFAQESIQKSTQTIHTAVEHAANIQTQVIVDQRGMIGEQMDIARQGLAKVRDLLGTVADLRDLAAWNNAHKSSVEVMSKLIDKQRQNYGIDEADRGDESIEDVLRRLS